MQRMDWGGREWHGKRTDRSKLRQRGQAGSKALSDLEVEERVEREPMDSSWAVSHYVG